MRPRARRERAVILLDHGSRERAANEQLATVARALARRLPRCAVATAHLSLTEPTLAACIAACVAKGAREVVVVPYFLAPGRHVRRDIPRLAREARRRHPGVRVRVAAPLGVHPGLVAAVRARVVAATASRVKRPGRAASRAGSS